MTFTTGHILIMGKSFKSTGAVSVLFCLITVCVCSPTRLFVSHFSVDILNGFTLNDRPIIGVAAQETETGNKHGDTYIPASYIKYLWQAGARVVPIRANEPPEYYSDLFGKINGVLFPGGEVSVTDSYYARTGRIFYDLSLQAAGKGDYFPLWGTCLGFQLLVTITAEKKVLQDTPADNITLPLNFVPGFRKSQMFGNAPEDVIQYLQNEPVTQNEHRYGIVPDVFFNTSKLSNFYKVLSTNLDTRGQTFISTIEAYKYPIYGTQWHPEKNAFNWNPQYVINHDAHAVRVAQYTANFFVNEARKSTHRFKSASEESAALIDNYSPLFSTDGTFNENYFFNYSTTILPLPK